MSNPIIKIRNLKVGWEAGNPTTFDFSIDLNAGVHCVVGPNGTGKSTLLRTIAGIIPPLSGSIERNGTIGYLGHKQAIYSHLTIRQNITAWSELLDFDHNGREKLDEIITQLSGNELMDKLPMQFSQGQFQRAGLMRSFIGFPKIIILDEPTAGLDPILKDKVQNLLVEHGKQCCIIVSSHDIGEVARIADNIIRLQKNMPVSVVQSSQIYGGNLSHNYEVGLLVESSHIDKLRQLLSDRDINMSKTGWVYVTLKENELLGDLLKQVLGASVPLLSVDDSSFIRSLYAKEESNAV